MIGESLDEIAIVIKRVQMTIFDVVRKRALKYFSELVPNKHVDLVLVGNTNTNANTNTNTNTR